MQARPHSVTDELRAWSDGDPEALDRLVPQIYEELHRAARRAFEREARSRTLQPTAIVHEVYLRLAGEKEVRWKNRAHFFGAAARLMRRVLVDHARERQALKRGGAAPTVSLEDSATPASESEVDLLALDQILDRLSAMDARQGRLVELRYFAGLTIPETAQVLGIGTATVIREWRTARAWLFKQLREGV